MGGRPPLHRQLGDIVNTALRARRRHAALGERAPHGPLRGLSTVYEAAGAELPAGDDEDGGDVSQSLQLSEER